MKVIKKYWDLIVGALLGIIGIVIAIMKKQDNKKADKIDQKIDNNKQQIDILTGKIEVVEDQREEVKQDIKEQEAAAEETKDAKDSIEPETPTSVADAKENILNKTKRRGRKKKS